MSTRAFLLVMSMATLSATIPDGSSPSDEPQIKRGGKVVTLRETPVQAGTTTLATVPLGTELLVESVHEHWVGVAVERDAKKIRGWMQVRNLAPDPAVQFAQLAAWRRTCVHFWRLLEEGDAGSDELTAKDLQHSKLETAVYRSAHKAVKLMDQDDNGKISEREFETQTAEALFLRFDQDADSCVTLDDFSTAVRKPSLDELNKQLHSLRTSANKRNTLEDYSPVAFLEAIPTKFLSRVLTKGLHSHVAEGALNQWTPGEIGGAANEVARRRGLSPVAYLRMVRCVVLFEGWGDDWLDRMFRRSWGPRHLVDDYLMAGDIRRSGIAQQLVQRESSTEGAQKIQALFAWADKNRDGRLTFDEFSHALSEKAIP